VTAHSKPVAFDPVRFEKELKAFETLLKKTSLTEAGDIQPFFQKRLHLSAYIGTYSAELGPATDYAFEYGLFGDYRPDLVLGNKKTGQFCVVEFEDGTPDSIFKKQPGRRNPEWSRRFDHGFSQIVDWYYNLDDYKKTHGSTGAFGHGEVNFIALLIIGRSASLDDAKRNRLKWRTQKVIVDSKRVFCLTYDELYEGLRSRYFMYKDASTIEPKGGGKR
jgi:hypothetical protein